MLENKLKSEDTLALEEGIVLHSLPDQSFYYAFSVINGDQFRLNRTSFWVLEEISEGIAWLKLKENFLATFEISAKQGEADLRKLLNDLYNQKIIGRSNDEK